MTAPPRIAVMLHPPDPICRTGVVSRLRRRPEATLVDAAGRAFAYQHGYL
ncbi:hypothetical protein [Kitasatospora sp. NPDC051164]